MNSYAAALAAERRNMLHGLFHWAALFAVRRCSTPQYGSAWAQL